MPGAPTVTQAEPSGLAAGSGAPLEETSSPARRRLISPDATPADNAKILCLFCCFCCRCFSSNTTTTSSSRSRRVAACSNDQHQQQPSVATDTTTSSSRREALVAAAALASLVSWSAVMPPPAAQAAAGDLDLTITERVSAYDAFSDSGWEAWQQRETRVYTDTLRGV